MRKVTMVLAISISLTVLIIAGFPRLGDAQQIYGCYGKFGGLLRVVSSPNQCNTRLEIPISWNAVGPPGPAGADGHSPVLTWSGDQIAIDGSVKGPHLTGPQGLPGVANGIQSAYAVTLMSAGTAPPLQEVLYSDPTAQTITYNCWPYLIPTQFAPEGTICTITWTSPSTSGMFYNSGWQNLGGPHCVVSYVYLVNNHSYPSITPFVDPDGNLTVTIMWFYTPKCPVDPTTGACETTANGNYSIPEMSAICVQ